MQIKIPDEILKEMENNLVPFRYVVLANDPEKELPAADFHYKLSDLLMNSTAHIAIEMFRESGKSSYALRTFPLHCLAYPKKGLDFIVIIKQNQRSASAKLKDIISEYEANPLLRHNLVEIKEQSMNAFSVNVRDRDGEIINIRIEAYGKGAGIRGLSNQDRRPSIVILDDIQDKDDSRSETVLSADWDWFLSDVIFLGRSSRIFMIGNNLGEKCVIERCIQNADRLRFKAIKIPVMIDGKPTWEAKQSLEDILQEKEDYTKLGKIDIWMAEKMCVAVAEESKVFKSDDYRYFSSHLREDIIRRSNLFACLDPASSPNPESCYRAITLTAVDTNNYWFLLDVKYGRWDSAEMVDIIFDFVAKYHLQNFYIEKGWWEQVMKPFFMKEMSRRNIFFNVVPLEHAKQGSKLERIKILQPRFKAHTVFFEEGASWLTEFEGELAGVTKDAIKSEYIDCVDAFAMTEQVAIAPVNARAGVIESERRRIVSDNSSQSLFSLAGY